MLHKLLIITSLLILTGFQGLTQVLSGQPTPPVTSAAEPVSEPAYSPSEWRQDSSWYWGWNNTTMDWRKYQRTLRTINNSGRLVSMLILSWDFGLSEWMNQERYDNEYFPDHTTPEYKFRMVWNPTDQAWMAEFYAAYESDGDPLEIEEKNYDASSNNYTSGSKRVFSYTSSGRLVLETHLDIPTMAWKNFSRTTHAYDVNGNILSALNEAWVAGTSSWLYTERFTATYAGPDRPLEELYEQWNPVLGAWQNQMKMVYEYNSSDWLITQTMYGWDDILFAWEQVVRISYHYDENGNRIQGESYEWDDAVQLWIPNQKEIYSWHPNGMPHETFRYLWIPALSLFKEIEYTALDNAGNETEHYSKSVNMSTYEYYEGYRTVSVYTDGLLGEKLSQALEVPAQTWADTWRLTDSYDAHGNCILELNEIYDQAGSIWTNSSKTDHFYSSYLGIGEEEKGLGGLCVFRNPAQAGEEVACPGLEPGCTYRMTLMTLSGRLVTEQTVVRGGSFRLPLSLAPGTYVLRADNGNGHSTAGKVVVY